MQYQESIPRIDSHHHHCRGAQPSMLIKKTSPSRTPINADTKKTSSLTIRPSSPRTAIDADNCQGGHPSTPTLIIHHRQGEWPSMPTKTSLRTHINADNRLGGQPSTQTQKISPPRRTSINIDTERTSSPRGT